MRGFGFCNFPPCTSMLSLALLWSLPPLQAEMVTLNESEMSEIDGAGIGLVLDNFAFSHGTDAPDANGNQARIFRITGIKSTDGQDVDITVNHLYIAGADSAYGQNLTPPVNLGGRLLHPWRIDVVDGNTIGGVRDKSVLEIAAPAMLSAAEGYDCWVAQRLPEAVPVQAAPPQLNPGSASEPIWECR